MLPFQEQIIADLLSDPSGGLVILSSGLSLPSLLSSLISLHHHSSGPLLILSPHLSSFLRHHLLNDSRSRTPAPKTDNPNPNPNPNSVPPFPLFSNCRSPASAPAILTGDPNPILNQIYEITAELPAHRRLALYTSGATLFITSRILIVDLLTARLRPDAVAGVVILNAHSISESSTEAFIVRILRTGNQKFYVWAFSDKPQAMVAGFAKTERIMRCLYLKKLHLWPRFQVYVSQDLEKNPPEVVDLRVPISPYMKVIQKAVIEVMDSCLKEMRKTNKVDVDDLTVENGLFKSFDEIVRKQLDPIWHTLGKKTKQLVSDLKTLRKLLDYLVRYDAVTYLKYLDSLRASESFRSVWIFAESSYKIFEYAKKRVYQFKRLDGEQLMGKKKALTTTKKRKVASGSKEEDSLPATLTSEVVLEEVLEEAPKWKVLHDVLQEIEEEREKQALLSGEQLVELDEDNGIILVVCKDEYSCMQLEDCITKGPQKVMHEEWEKYLLSKVELRNEPKGKKKKASGPKGFGLLDGVVPIVPGQKEEVSESNYERKALLAAAARINKRIEKDIVEDDTQRKGKRKSNEVLINNNTEKLISEIGALKTKESASVSRSVLQKHSVGVDATTSKDARRLPPVCFHALESERNMLDTLKPSTVIVYHPDMAFVRELEIYKAENPLKKLKVYFLFYEESTEVQKFEASIRRENGAFELLIRQKSMMMIPVDQDGRCLGPSSSIDPQPSTPNNSITRKAGGRKEVEKEMQIIVDMREFMSSLPNVLHQKGMRIIPVTLEVGDYILSPSICVERKSIQDLFGSFASGRLFHQVEMMSRYYRIPVLLIEFSQDKSFSFLSASDIGDDVTPNSIISKLSLLVLHFPRLRIIWSRSLHATAEIFASLKANQDEPDEIKAIRVGVPSEEGIVENDVRAENYNTSAVEFLRRLPGVTDSNYRTIMDNCECLADLATLPLEKLAELMGGQKAAKTLRDFLDAKYPTLL